MDLGEDATGYSECGEGSDPTCPQCGRATQEGGSGDNCLPEGTEGSGGCVPAGRDLKLSFADADHADRCSNRRSVLGVAVILRNTAVSASSTTQHCVTLSTS